MALGKITHFRTNAAASIEESTKVYINYLNLIFYFSLRGCFLLSLYFYLLVKVKALARMVKVFLLFVRVDFCCPLMERDFSICTIKVRI